jgi:hypothetical protein
MTYNIAWATVNLNGGNPMACAAALESQKNHNTMEA